MSRSVHTTRRELERLEATDFGVAERRESELARARERLEQKRRIKAAVARERRAAASTQPTPVDTVPVVVTGASEHAHHPAGVDDIRAVLRLLPPGVLDGIARVELRLGAEDQRELEANDPAGADADPFVGRLGYEVFPGVYTGRVLGTYEVGTAVIRLHAFVYHSATPLREVWEVLLRAWALSTLAHEVAHHHDHTTRVARGRWIAEGEDRVERYAEGRQHAWTQGVVVPYVRRSYAADVSRLERWVAHHGGVFLPFETLVDDPRGRIKGGYVELNVVLWPMRQALEGLAEDVLGGESPSTCRVAFARGLHYREMYAEALASLARVLADDPAHEGALTLRADIFVHQGRYEDALAIARGLTDGRPTLANAWEVVADALEGLERWDELRAAANRLIDLYREDEDRLGRMSALLQRARANLRSGDPAAAAADLNAVETLGPLTHQRRHIARFRAELAAAGRGSSDA